MSKRKNILGLVVVLFVAAFYPAGAQSSKTVCRSCNFLVTIAPPQLLTQKILTQSEVDLVYLLAERSGLLPDDGTVSCRDTLAGFALLALEQTGIGLSFGSAPANGALVGYILEMEEAHSFHYALTGTNKTIVFNPCDANSPIKALVEVYVFAY